MFDVSRGAHKQGFSSGKDCIQCKKTFRASFDTVLFLMQSGQRWDASIHAAGTFQWRIAASSLPETGYSSLIEMNLYKSVSFSK
jgi:hypothetical protein